jgi:CHAD domain-containing protein
MTPKVNAAELLIRQRFSDLDRALPGAKAGDVSAIHQARVATRRLREALPLITKGSSGRKLERKVATMTRALGPVRELDVAIGMLDEFAAARDVGRGGVAALRHVINDERRRLHRDMVRALDRCNLEKLTKRAVAAAKKRDRAAAETAHQRNPRRLDIVRRRAARRAQRVKDAMENAAGIYLPDRLHEVRIALKKLRYAMEIARELSRSRAVAKILALKRLQDLLGRMHDLEVLIARTRALQGSPSAPSLRLSAELDQLVRRLETECRQLHGQYIAARPSLAAICEHVMSLPDASDRREPAA